MSSGLLYQSLQASQQTDRVTISTAVISEQDKSVCLVLKSLHSQLTNSTQVHPRGDTEARMSQDTDPGIY